MFHTIHTMSTKDHVQLKTLTCGMNHAIFRNGENDGIPFRMTDNIAMEHPSFEDAFQDFPIAKC